MFILMFKFLTLNSKLFSDLIYHVPFQRSFNCKNPQIQKKIVFVIFLGALHDEKKKKKNIRSSFTLCISRTLLLSEKIDMSSYSYQEWTHHHQKIFILSMKIL